MIDLGTMAFDDRGLVPAVVQDARNGRVLMLAFMNPEALQKTLETREAHFWSRSRMELWRKGATSGNTMKVVEVVPDCDRDAVLVRVEPAGPACHTGAETCFFDWLAGEPSAHLPLGGALSMTLDDLARTIRDRKEKLPEGSYTARLLAGGRDRILKKIGEEATEVVIAGKNDDREELTRESADLLYHLLVLWEASGVTLPDVCAELDRRRGGGAPRQDRL